MLSEKPWTIERVALMVLAMFLCLCLFAILQSAILKMSGLEKPDENSPSYVVFLGLTPQMAIVAATGFVLWWCQLDWKKSFGISRWSINRSLFWGVLTAIIFLPVGGFLKWASVYEYHRITGKTPVEQEAVKIFQDTHNPFNHGCLIVFAITLAPLGEELLFRGILFPAIRRLGFPKLAIWSTALVFGAIHGSWAIFVPLTVLGAALAMLYEHTDNILAPITAHAVFNIINVAELAFSQNSPPGTQGWFHWLGS